jgi:hypothetical protein
MGLALMNLHRSSVALFPPPHTLAGIRACMQGVTKGIMACMQGVTKSRAVYGTMANAYTSVC